MPANLPPEFLEARERFQRAETIPEKIQALQEMLAVLPKHKGTEKLYADLRRRLSKLRQMEQQSRRGKSTFNPTAHITKQGAGQVVLIGYPNVGKSSLLNALTGAQSRVADFPYSTPLPVPAMMQFENVQIQLIDTPPISREYFEPWVGDLARRGDAVVLVVDLGSDDLLDQIDVVRECLRQVKVELVLELPMEADCDRRIAYRRTAIAANKVDVDGALERLEILRELYGDQFTIIPTSALTGDGLDELRKTIWQMLGAIRVYTKRPGEKPDLSSPFILKRGSTVLDLAEAIHNDFAERLKCARVWGSAKFPGQPVEKDYVLQEGDIVELHT
ncbi:MAG: TGS domain-containing protein [Armatimonadota bacterium]|nr:TGS domain-containing protein [Armatimonadota bacterium]MCX7778442.1 TGS domain-containing protein [Armatimonadota bacterium]MDW8026352.1 TGS domain-containing protein [Armatimonadota bacterium]